MSQPLLRWAGSKRKLIPVLRSYWTEDHERYVEPFAGSACLFFALNPKRAILGDLNEELIKMYLEVKYRSRMLSEELAHLGRRDKKQYDRLRSADPSTLSRSRRAARFIYLNRFCFNGIYRTNLEGRFNVPFGGEGTGELPDEASLQAYSKALCGARLINEDFEVVADAARPGDLVYMDPPYATGAKRVFREYHPDTFVPADIARLRSCMEMLDKKGIDFVVSYGESPEADILKRNFYVETVSVRRNVAGFSAHRKMSAEVLISNIQRRS